MATNNTTSNTIGMGVDLHGGMDVLTMLRQIRAEGRAIKEVFNGIDIPDGGMGVGGVSSMQEDPNQLRMFADQKVYWNNQAQSRMTRTNKQANQQEVTDHQNKERAKTSATQTESGKRKQLTDAERIAAGKNLTAEKAKTPLETRDVKSAAELRGQKEALKQSLDTNEAKLTSYRRTEREILNLQKQTALERINLEKKTEDEIAAIRKRVQRQVIGERVNARARAVERREQDPEFVPRDKGRFSIANDNIRRYREKEVERLKREDAEKARQEEIREARRTRPKRADGTWMSNQEIAEREKEQIAQEEALERKRQQREAQRQRALARPKEGGKFLSDVEIQRRADKELLDERTRIERERRERYRDLNTRITQRGISGVTAMEEFETQELRLKKWKGLRERWQKEEREVNADFPGRVNNARRNQYNKKVEGDVQEIARSLGPIDVEKTNTEFTRLLTQTNSLRQGIRGGIFSSAIGKDRRELAQLDNQLKEIAQRSQAAQSFLTKPGTTLSQRQNAVSILQELNQEREEVQLSLQSIRDKTLDTGRRKEVRRQYGPTRDDFVDARAVSLDLDRINAKANKLRQDLSKGIFNNIYNPRERNLINQLITDLGRLSINAEGAKYNIIDPNRPASKAVLEMSAIRAKDLQKELEYRVGTVEALRGDAIGLPERKAPRYDAGPRRDQFFDTQDGIKQLDRLRDTAIKTRQGFTGSFFKTFSESAKTDLVGIDMRMSSLIKRAGDLRAELARPGGIKRLKNDIVRDLTSIGHEIDNEIEKLRQLKLAALQPGRIRSVVPGGPPNNPPNNRGPRSLDDPKGLFNDKGFFTSADAVGRITRNILLYEVVSAASYGLVQYVGDAVNAAKATIEFANALRFATEQAGGNLQANNLLVEGLRPLGLSRQQSRQAVTEAVRFAEDAPEKTEALTRTVADIAASRGGGIDKTDEVIEQLRRREPKYYKRLFGITTEQIYEREALRAIRNQIGAPEEDVLSQVKFGDKAAASQLDQGLSRDSRSKGNYLTERDLVKRYVADMTDAQKEAASLNFVVSQQSKFMGEADKRAQTLAGRIDRMAAAFLDAKEGVGIFITELKPVNDLFESMTKNAGFLDSLRGPEIQRSGGIKYDNQGRPIAGSGNVITDADIRQYQIDKTTGSRSELLNSINQSGTDVLLGAGAIGAAALYGRRRATIERRNQVYEKNLPGQLERFGTNNAAAAQAEARNAAMQEKAGLIRSTIGGLKRVTLGLTDFILQSTNSMATAIAGEKTLAGRLSLVPLEMRKGYGPIQSAYNVRKNIGWDENPSKFSRGLTETTYLPPTERNVKYGQSQRSPYASPDGFIRTAQTTFPTITSNRTFVGGIETQDRIDRRQLYADRGGLAGGVIGGGLGAAFGSQLADTLKVGTITAAALTILGGVAGSAGGTALGSIVGGAVSANPVIGAVGTGLAVGVTGLGFAIRDLTLWLQTGRGPSPQNDKPVGEKVPFGIEGTLKRAEEELRAAREGRLRYRDTTTDRVYTPDNVPEDRTNIKTEIADPYRGLDKIIFQQRQEIEVLRQRDDVTEPQRESLIKNLQDSQSNELQTILYPQLEKVKASYYERVRNETEEAERKAAQAMQERINQISNALSKLRDAQSGSFRLVGDVGRQVAPDNSFVGPQADFLTAAERMRQQWGFLGDGMVSYFTKLEQRTAKLGIIKASFDSLTASLNLQNRAAKDLSERQNPFTRSTVQTLAGEAFSVGAQSIESNRTLDRRERSLRLGVPRQARTSQGRINQLNDRNYQTSLDAINQIAQLRSTYQRAAGAGGDNTDLQERMSEEILKITGQFSTGYLTGTGAYRDRRYQTPYAGTLKQASLDAIKQQRAANQRKTEESFYKVAEQQKETDRISRDFEGAEFKRKDLLSRGFNADDVGREYDKYLLARTDNIPVKDLTKQQFSLRQEAQQREVRREVNKEDEAKKATAEGLAIQNLLLQEVTMLREAILGGDAQMLVQVQNDTQARIDQQALLDGPGKGYKVNLDQGQTKTNPATTNSRTLNRKKYGNK
jgi:hypothetical protein